MRVLVTGHKGFIGAVMVPMLLQAGVDVVGMDTDYYRDCTFAGSLADIHEIDRDIRDAEPCRRRGLRRRHPPRRAVERPARRLRPGADLRHQPPGHDPPGAARPPGRRPRFLFSSSCSNYGAAGDDLLDETAAFNPVTAYGDLEGAGRAGPARAGHRRLQPGAPAQRDRLRRRRPGCGATSCSTTSPAWAVATGKVLIKSDGTPWRPIVHVEDISRAFLAALHAPRRPSTLRRSTSPGRTRTTASASWPRSCEATVPGCEIEFADDASPDTRNYRVDASKIAGDAPGLPAAVDGADGARQLYEAFMRARITLDDIEGWRFRRIGQIKRLLDAGLLTASSVGAN